MNSLTPELERAVIILKRINNNLKVGNTSLEFIGHQMRKEYNSTWNDEELNKMRVTLFCVASSVIIWHVAFQDEYDGGFAKAMKNHDVIMFRKLREKCSEFVDISNEMFPELKTIRNTILAHGFRWKKGEHVDDVDINRLMNQATGKDINYYFQLCRLPDLMVSEIEKVLGTVNEELVIEEDDQDENSTY